MRVHYLWAALTCCVSLAEEPLRLESKKERHEVGFQVPIWVRARASFTGFEMTQTGPNDGRGNVERFYVDGYNKVDITGNEISPAPPARYSFPRTSNFKFDSITQVKNDPDPSDSEAADPNGGTLALHNVAVSGGRFASDRDADLSPGVELFYRYSWLQKQRWSLDWELGASVQQLEWQMTSPVGSDVDVITDVYPLGGVVLRPANAGQEGAFDDTTGRKPVIGSVPQRSLTKSSGIVVGNHELGMDALFVRLGPALSWEVSHRWHFDLLGGLSVGIARTEYNYVNRAVREVSVDGIPLPVPTLTGSVSDSSVHLGFYSALRTNYRLTEKWGAHAEVRHLWLDSFRFSAPLGSAEVNLSDSLAIVLGITRRF